jgi:hypothetical protein
MKKMDVGDIRPREVISNSNVQVDTNQTSSSSQVQEQQVASTLFQPNDQPSASNQVQVL